MFTLTEKDAKGEGVIHSDWLSSGTNVDSDGICLTIGFFVPQYEGEITAQVFALPINYDGETWPTQWKKPRLFIERANYQGCMRGFRTDYACSGWKLTEREVFDLLAADTDTAMGMMAKKIVEVLALPNEEVIASYVDEDESEDEC